MRLPDVFKSNLRFAWNFLHIPQILCLPMQISRCHVQIFLTVSWTFYSIIGSSFKNIPAELAFASMVYDKGVPLDNCWDFVDGTVRAISRPGIHQRVLYNGHKIYHTLKFQSVVASNGLTANSHEPVEDKGHGNDMLMDSGLLSTSTKLIWSKSTSLMHIWGSFLSVKSKPASWF